MNLDHVGVHDVHPLAKSPRQCVGGSDVGLELGSAVISELKHYRGLLEQALERHSRRLI